MRRLVVLGLLVLLLTFAFGACSTTGPDCGPFKDKFKTTDFSSSVFKATPDSLRVSPNLSAIEGDTLEGGRIAVRMEPVKMLYSMRLGTSHSFQIINSAYACSPAEPTSEELIKDIRIYSDKHFRDGFSAGEDLAELFDIFALREADYGWQQFELDNFLAREPNAADELILILDAKPKTTSSFQFTVEYEQEGKGLEYYKFKSDPVVLKSS